MANERSYNPNVNVYISQSIETVAEIKTRLEIFKESQVSAEERWRCIRPLVHKFVTHNDDVSQSYAFSAYASVIVRELASLLDELKPKASGKG